MERHDGIAYELVQALDAPVLQTVEKLPNVVQFFSAQLPVFAEPVIEVPKILPHDVPPRRLCRDTQLAEQLVEVPTVLSYSSLQQLIGEQTVDIPVPGRAGGEGGEEVFKVSLDRIQQRLLELIVLTFPVEVFKALAQDRVLPHRVVCMRTQMLEFKGFFASFPRRKKSAGLGPHSGSELGADFTP